MNYNPRNPLIIQSDMTMLLEVDSPLFEEVRDAVAPFAEIIKSPEHVHTYRITPISLWNAASSGISPEEVIKSLRNYSRYEIPHNLLVEVNDIMGRFGKVRIERHDEAMLKLITREPLLMEQLYHTDSVRNFLAVRIWPQTVVFSSVNRGLIKQALIKAGYPAIDMAGYAEGLPLGISLRENNSFKIRPYQIMARDAFYKGGTALGGNGVVVLPCGAGKTIVGMAVMDLIKLHSLILTTGITAIRQWRRELIDKTDIDPEDIGEYSGEVKEIRPVTITTYQILTHRKSREDDFLHLQTLNKHPWGLLIYDEVHLLPAQVFRFTASLQAIRRLGLTATLAREDGREGDVFSPIGPKCFDVPWKVIEKQGWITEAECFEIRTRITGDTRFRYVSEQYHGCCQVTGTTFPKASRDSNGVAENYFESCSLLPYTNTDYLNDAGNMLCVSADTMAKFKCASITFFLDSLEDAIETFKANGELAESVSVKIRLAGEECLIKWSQRHFMRLVALYEKARWRVLFRSSGCAF